MQSFPGASLIAAQFLKWVSKWMFMKPLLCAVAMQGNLHVFLHSNLRTTLWGSMRLRWVKTLVQGYTVRRWLAQNWSPDQLQVQCWTPSQAPRWEFWVQSIKQQLFHSRGFMLHRLNKYKVSVGKINIPGIFQSHCGHKRSFEQGESAMTGFQPFPRERTSPSVHWCLPFLCVGQCGLSWTCPSHLAFLVSELWAGVPAAPLTCPLCPHAPPTWTIVQNSQWGTLSSPENHGLRLNTDMRRWSRAVQTITCLSSCMLGCRTLQWVQGFLSCPECFSFLFRLRLFNTCACLASREEG